MNRSALVVQYYSSWMGCSDGITPEPPVLPQGMERLWTHTTRRTTVFGQTNDKNNQKEEPTEGLNETIDETVNTIRKSLLLIWISMKIKLNNCLNDSRKRFGLGSRPQPRRRGNC